jgi:hypothetical protein
MEKERLKRDLNDNEDSLKTLQSSLKKQADDCREKQEALGEDPTTSVVDPNFSILDLPGSKWHRILWTRISNKEFKYF